jgi:O-antigen ligase
VRKDAAKYRHPNTDPGARGIPWVAPHAFLYRCLRLVSFALLVTGLAYAAFDQTIVGWNISLLILGTGAVLYLLALSLTDFPSFVGPLLGWALLLPSAYVGFQVLPLPLTILRILSPARVHLVESLMPITQTPAFAAISIDSSTTAVYLLRTLAYSLSSLLIFAIYRYNGSRRSWAPVVPLIAIAAFEACLGILQFGNGGDVAGTYKSRDHFAGLLEMVLPLAVACAIFLLKDSDGRESLPVSKAIKACVVFASAAAMLAGLVYSQSKMGFAAGLSSLFAMGAVTVLSKLKGIRGWMALAGLAVSIILLFVFLPTDQLAGAYTQFFSNDPASLEGRAPIWGDSRKLLSAYPVFGTGLGTYATAFLKYQTANLDWDYTFAHNDYLELGSELGVVGFLIFGGLFLTTLIKAIRAACTGDWNTRLLGLGCTGALTAIGIHSLADFNLYIPTNALALSWIVGVAIGLPSRTHPWQSNNDVEERATRYSNLFQFLSSLALRTVPVLFGFLLVSYASAWIMLETKYKGDPRAATAFCRFGICDTDAILAAEALGNMGNVSKVPLTRLVEAVKREPAAPHRWCDLGDALLREGRLEQARYCFSNALELGPEIPPILFRSANFYHAAQEDNLALKQGARVFEKSDVYRTPILDWYRNRKFSVNDVLRRGLPPGPNAAQSYLSYWTGLGDVSNAKTTWDWILSHHYAGGPAAREYITFLFGNGKYREASAEWARFLGDRRHGYLESNWLFNGDFETEPAGVPLDWTIGSVPGQVGAALDSKVAHTGKHCLRIQFSGTENVSYSQTAQMTSVPPGTYRFTAYIRTEDITTDKGVALRIFDPANSSRLDARTDQFVGTTDWKRVEQTVRVTGETELLEIQVIREPTMKFDNKVSGIAWIDTVSLSRIE